MPKTNGEAQERNKKKELTCIECCMGYTLNSDGQWTARGGEKVAQLVADRILYCTCQTVIGVVATQPLPVEGEVVAIL